MADLKKDLRSIVKSLKAMTQKTEKLAIKLEKLEKAQVKKSPKRKVAVKAKKKPVTKKAAKGKAIDNVLAIIKRSRNGVDSATLRKKTGFEGRKLRDIIYRLNKQGQIKSKGRGFYIKA